MITDFAAYQRQRRARFIANGLCRDCGAKRYGKIQHCLTCALRRCRADRRYYLKHRLKLSH